MIDTRDFNRRLDHYLTQSDDREPLGPDYDVCEKHEEAFPWGGKCPKCEEEEK